MGPSPGLDAVEKRKMTAPTGTPKPIIHLVAQRYKTELFRLFRHQVNTNIKRLSFCRHVITTTTSSRSCSSRSVTISQHAFFLLDRNSRPYFRISFLSHFNMLDFHVCSSKYSSLIHQLLF